MPPQHRATQPNSGTKPPSIFGLLGAYRGWIAALVALTIIANAFTLVVPKLIAHAIDAYTANAFVLSAFLIEFSLVSAGIFIFTYLQSIVQTLASERVARDLRNAITAKISVQEYSTIDKVTPAKLLTNLTSDVDAVKNFVSLAIASLISSVVLIIGASGLLLFTNWKLALAVLIVLPVIAVTFFLILGRVRKLFRQAQEVLDWLNKVITESILGAPLIRILESQNVEYGKFVQASGASRELGLRIVGYFSLLIPVIGFVTNIATLIILGLGGYFVIGGSMSIGNFTAFNAYLAILIFPIIIIGFMSNVIAQATASYGRISEMLYAPDPERSGTLTRPLTGAFAVKDISLSYGEHQVLKDVSFSVRAGTKNAIIGPTAAGKTQLLYLLTGLLQPSAGIIEYDSEPLAAYDKERFHEQVGFVFQDSIIFNLSLRENIAFSATVTDAALAKAIETAELQDFIAALPDGLDTVVSERGTSLSGGQKQRIMLARALALEPKLLLLDEFTARVDMRTERTILANVAKNYPDLTLVSVTQRIQPIEGYDQIIVLMEGEMLATGTHGELMATSPEYVQIYDSQKSTEGYE